MRTVPFSTIAVGVGCMVIGMLASHLIEPTLPTQEKKTEVDEDLETWKQKTYLLKRTLGELQNRQNRDTTVESSTFTANPSKPVCHINMGVTSNCENILSEASRGTPRCLINIRGECGNELSQHHHMSNRSWFDDSQFGGPRRVTVSDCYRRQKDWQATCGNEAIVDMRFNSPAVTARRMDTPSQPTDNEGPTMLEGLPADEVFTASMQYQEMLAFIKERHPNIEDMRRQFQDQGYITFKPEIPKLVLDGARNFTQEVFDECIVGPKPPHCVNKHQDKFTHVPAVKALAQDYHIRAMLAVLHRHDPFPFQTLNYPCTSLARTHSDYVHFAAHPLPLMSAVWTALIDVSPDAGPVFYYPGSHKHSHFNMQDFGLDRRQDGKHNYPKYQDIQTRAMEKMGLKRELAIIPEGHVLVWSANLIHGGPKAKKEAIPRLSQVTHYFFRGSNYQWAPVASDVSQGRVTYYDETAINKKWGDEGTPDERFALSKFRDGGCDDFNGAQGTISPCQMMHRGPRVMSDLLSHDTTGESVM